MQITLYSQTALLITILTLHSLPVMAQDAALPEQDPVTEESILIPGSETLEGQESRPEEVPLISTWDFIRMLLILGIVVAVIYLIFFLLRRAMRRRIPENDLIRLLGSRALSGSRNLHLIEVGRNIFLIGDTDGGITLLAEIQDQETVDTIRLDSSRELKAPGLSFSNLLQTLLAPGRKERFNAGKTVDYMKRQRERLKKL